MIEGQQCDAAGDSGQKSKSKNVRAGPRFMKNASQEQEAGQTKGMGDGKQPEDPQMTGRNAPAEVRCAPDDGRGQTQHAGGGGGRHRGLLGCCSGWVVALLRDHIQVRAQNSNLDLTETAVQHGNVAVVAQRVLVANLLSDLGETAFNRVGGKLRVEYTAGGIFVFDEYVVVHLEWNVIAVQEPDN